MKPFWLWAIIGLFAVSGCRRTADSSTIAIDPTFTRDVAQIVHSKCAPCHHAGESAPFNLVTYDDVKRRARQIVEVTQSGFMPPWLPSPGHGDFVGERRLNASELTTIQKWVESGAPLGDPAQMPATPVFADGWQLGTPDVILETPAYSLTSHDRDVFRNFVVPVPFAEPRWISAIELRPENPRVTHHARLGVDRSNESTRRDADDAAPGYDGMAWGQDPDGQLVIWAPGLRTPPLTPGVAWRLFPKSTLVLHTHMQPSGKPEIVKFRIGLYFAKAPPTQHPVMMRVGSCNIDIPAGERRHVVTDQYTLPIDVDVHTIFPHAHSLCRELNVVAVQPNGSRIPLIAISKFDENWHDAYRYRRPVRLPRASRIESTFIYDNSDGNVRNRNRPACRVVYGSNATDEMADVYLQVTPVHADQRAVLTEDYKRYELQAKLVGNRKSLELYPNNPWSQEALAAALVGLGDAKKAIPILEARAKAAPREVFPSVSLGMTLLAAGNLAGAETQLRAALAIDANDPLAWFGLGKALTALRRPEDAEHAYRRSIELSPSSSEAYVNLADVLLARGEIDKAAAVCRSAIEQAPDAAGSHLKYAEVLAKQKKYDESLERCRIAQSLAPYTHPPRVLLAVICCGSGELDRGLRLLHEARAEQPNHPMPLLVLGQLTRKQDPRIARDYLAAAATRPIPDNWPASHRQRFLILLHSERLQLAQQLQDADLARDALTKWIDCEPENDKLKQMLGELPAKSGR